MWEIFQLPFFCHHGIISPYFKVIRPTHDKSTCAYEHCAHSPNAIRDRGNRGAVGWSGPCWLLWGRGQFSDFSFALSVIPRVTLLPHGCVWRTEAICPLPSSAMLCHTVVFRVVWGQERKETRHIKSISICLRSVSSKTHGRAERKAPEHAGSLGTASWGLWRHIFFSENLLNFRQELKDRNSTPAHWVWLTHLKMCFYETRN